MTAPGSPSPGPTGPRWRLAARSAPGVAAAGPPGSRGAAGPGTEERSEGTVHWEGGGRRGELLSKGDDVLAAKLCRSKKM